MKWKNSWFAVLVMVLVMAGSAAMAAEIPEGYTWFEFGHWMEEPLNIITTVRESTYFYPSTTTDSPRGRLEKSDTVNVQVLCLLLNFPPVEPIEILEGWWLIHPDKHDDDAGWVEGSTLELWHTGYVQEQLKTLEGIDWDND